MITKAAARLFSLAAGAILIGACGISRATEDGEFTPIPTNIAAIVQPTATQKPTATAEADPPESPQAVIDVYNIYIGKDKDRQPELLQTEMVTIVPISEVEGFGGSHADIFLRGLSVNGNPILGGAEMLAQLITLLDEARQAGFVGQTVFSSYRSYEDQVFLTNRGENDYLQDTGQFLADPGRSEHQLGTAVDLGWGVFLLDPYIILNNEAAGDYHQWLKKNMHRFGFVISYPFKSKQDASMSNLFEAWITEYKAETWHIRFVGVSLATQIFDHQDEQGQNYLVKYSTIIPQQFYLP